jgi:chromosome partitioning protein
MAHTISLLNMKGGVGKSTLAVNLAWEYATGPWDRRILVADLDPQFNASQYLIGQQQYEKAVLEEAKPTMWDLFEQNTRMPGQPLKEFDPHAAIHPVRRFQAGGCIDLIPSRLELALSLRNPAQKESLLQKSLVQVGTDYDIIIIDCPPTESVLTYAAYLASDHLLVPVKPEYLSAIGLPLLKQSLGDFNRENPGHDLDVTGIVFNGVSDYSPEELTAKREVRQLAVAFNWRVFRAEVPYSRSFPKGAREGQPIFWTSYARTKPAQKFRDFAAEFARATGL